MNTSGRLKALAGRTGGAVCTSSNAHLVVDWARKQGKKILFVPDQHLGRNTADRLGMDLAKTVALPDPQDGATSDSTDNAVSRAGSMPSTQAEMILWGSYCGVHTVFTPEHVRWWKERGWKVLVHPESPLEVVREADGQGSTHYLWNAVMEAQAGRPHCHRHRRALRAQRARPRTPARCRDRAPRRHPRSGSFESAGCGCATMSRNDPPHLAGMLDLLRKGTPPDINRVFSGDNVDERTAARDRLGDTERSALVREARLSMERMIEITEAAK